MSAEAGTVVSNAEFAQWMKTNPTVRAKTRALAGDMYGDSYAGPFSNFPVLDLSKHIASSTAESTDWADWLNGEEAAEIAAKAIAGLYGAPHDVYFGEELAGTVADVWREQHRS